jgi:probable addiction module antidote protein
MATKKRSKAKQVLSRYDSADYLTTEAGIEEYLSAATEEAGDDPVYMLNALNTIARARGMMRLANDAGMTRAGLYKALAPNAKPSFQTVQKIAKALGFRLTFTRAA